MARGSYTVNIRGRTLILLYIKMKGFATVLCKRLQLLQQQSKMVLRKPLIFQVVQLAQSIGGGLYLNYW